MEAQTQSDRDSRALIDARIMASRTFEEYRRDSDGLPNGGVSEARGLLINWQTGPLGQGSQRKAPNGARVEAVIMAAKSRLEFYQSTDLRCDETSRAIKHLMEALDDLHDRTDKRFAAGVKGTNLALAGPFK